MLTQEQLLASLKYKPGDASYTIDSLPTLQDLAAFLRDIEQKGPVVHRSPMEPVVMDKSKFPVIRLASGKYSIKPNITRQNFLYRGESNYYPESKSRFGRGWTHAKGIIANVQVDELYWALRTTHPLYQMLANGVEVSDNEVIRIENPMAIATVYGLTTTQQHLTSDLDVALFYATTDYNVVDDTYVLHRIVADDDNTKVGCIYLFNIAMPMGQIPMLTTAGYLPFSRMKEQRTFLFNLGRDIDFTSIPLNRRLFFRHCDESDRRFSQLFNSGASLNPTDEVSALAKRILSSNSISERAFKANLRNNPTEQESKNLKELTDLGINISAEGFAFSSDDLASYYQRIEDGFWADFCSCLDFSTFKDPEEVMAVFTDLPNNPNFQKYFTK